ncbi:MAG: SH3 domain-containing protein [Lachnospiraceae bacterium]|nr:SH3 domain-containing protein [Lachnospiraceae bacterium]
MLKEKLSQIRDFILKHYKLVFPALLILCVAVTVVIALHANSRSDVEDIIKDSTQVATGVEGTTEDVGLNSFNTEVPLKQNEVPEIWSLVCTYYNAVALGDIQTIQNVCDQISETELLRFEEMAKYIDSYPTLEVYTKEGPVAGTTMVYVYYKVTFANLDAQFPGYQAHFVCTREDGTLYMKKSENAEEVDEYILAVSTQDDVVELNNKIEVEYNELMQNNPQTLLYLTELDAEVGKAVGERLAQLNASEPTIDPQQPTEGEGTGEESTPTEEVPTPEVPEITVMYAEATANVNVRSSDSEQADKLGRATKGTTLQVLEQGVNGWTKVSFEGKEGYIKSEYLSMLENADGQVVIGKVTATANVNVRSKASTSAERLGVLKGGAKVDLLGTENGWCKIIYDGRVGYVNADYVQ